jgi:hypothetical protein
MGIWQEMLLSLTPADLFDVFTDFFMGWFPAQIAGMWRKPDLRGVIPG